MTQILSTLAILIIAFNTLSFEQIKYLSKEYWLNSAKLGAFTEITSSNQLSAFPTTYNANLAKTIEIGTTTISFINTLPDLATTTKLSSIGTINTGIWNGTLISGAFGGTGSSTISANRVLLGNGSSGLTVATSTGSVGQVFKSAGEGKNPFWSSDTLDTTVNFNISGLWRFDSPLNASSTLSVNSKLNVSTSTPSQEVNLAVNGGALISGTTTVPTLVIASSTLQANGLTYQLPNSQSINNGQATTSLLMNNGFGGLTWGIPYSAGATSTSPGFISTQTINHGLGRIPVMIKIKIDSRCRDSNDTNEMSSCGSTGIATSTAAQYSQNVTLSSGKNTSSSGECQVQNHLTGYMGTGYSGNDCSTVDYQVALSDVNSTTFTLNWTTNVVATGGDLRRILWEVQ